MEPSLVVVKFVINTVYRHYILNYIEEDDIVLLPFDDSMTALGNPSVYANICHISDSFRPFRLSLEIPDVLFANHVALKGSFLEPLDSLLLVAIGQFKES